MKKNLTILWVGLLAFALCVFASTSQAVLVTSNSVVVFEDNFEDDTATPLPYHDPTNTGDFDPQPTGTVQGTWSIFEGAPKNIQVTDSKTPVFFPDPGSVPSDKGTNYLRIVRPDTAVANAVANIGSINATAVVHSEFWLYMPTLNNTNGTAISTATFRANLILAQSLQGSGDATVDTDPVSIFINRSQAGFGDLDIIFQTNTGLYADSGLNVIGDTWQLWTIDYEVGSGMFSISVDGASSGLLLINAAATNTYIGELLFRGAGVDTRWYIDDVIPEPSLFMLLTVGTTIIWGWKKRRSPIASR